MEDIICAYHEEPSLWDTLLNATEAEKAQARERICMIFGFDQETLRKKVSSFRAGLTREMTRERALRRGVERTAPVYKYTNLLTFLRPHIRIREKNSSTNGDLNEDQEENFDTGEASANGFENDTVEDEEEQEADEADTSTLSMIAYKVTTRESSPKRKKSKLIENSPNPVSHKTECAIKALPFGTTTYKNSDIDGNYKNDNRARIHAPLPDPATDRDWSFALCIYHMMHNLPKEVDRDEVQCQLMQVVSQAKSAARNNGARPVPISIARISSGKSSTTNCQGCSCSGSINSVEVASISHFTPRGQCCTKDENGLEEY